MRMFFLSSVFLESPELKEVCLGAAQKAMPSELQINNMHKEWTLHLGLKTYWGKRMRQGMSSFSLDAKVMVQSAW